MKDDWSHCWDILIYARRARQHAGGMTFEEFCDASTRQDAAIWCCAVIGEATKRLEPEFRAAHPQIPWSKMAGYRDVLIHAYDKLNFRRCWTVIEEDLPRLITELEAIIPPEEE